MTNPVEPVKSGVLLSGIDSSLNYVEKPFVFVQPLVSSAPFQTLYAPKAVSAKRPIKALKLPTQSMIRLDLPQKS